MRERGREGCETAKWTKIKGWGRERECRNRRDENEKQLLSNKVFTFYGTRID